MERIWSPWRMEYIKRTGRAEGCVFCDLPAMGDDETALILARGALSYVVLNKFPHNSGHLIIVPFRHTDAYEGLTPSEHAEVTGMTARSMEALKATATPHGFNIGVNQGTVAGAGIPDHIHVHVVPRWGGDTNFTSTVGNVKVMPESLEQTYAKLKPHF